MANIFEALAPFAKLAKKYAGKIGEFAKAKGGGLLKRVKKLRPVEEFIKGYKGEHLYKIIKEPLSTASWSGSLPQLNKTFEYTVPTTSFFHTAGRKTRSIVDWSRKKTRGVVNWLGKTVAKPLKNIFGDIKQAAKETGANLKSVFKGEATPYNTQNALETATDVAKETEKLVKNPWYKTPYAYAGAGALGLGVPAYYYGKSRRKRRR